MRCGASPRRPARALADGAAGRAPICCSVGLSWWAGEAVPRALGGLSSPSGVLGRRFRAPPC
eukprot:11210159-Lingulodinium_polyedra.AAC.1